MTARDRRLDQAHVAFIESGGTIYVASRDAKLRTALAYGLGCRVSPDRRRIGIFLAASWCDELLASIRETRAIAVSFAQPGSHKTLQLKGDDAEIGPPEPGDAARQAAYLAKLVENLMRAGVPEALVRTVVTCEPADLVVVRFSPVAAYSQTPGPQAGNRVEL